MADVNLSEDRLYPCGWGLVFKVVCAPSSWPAERVSAQATADDPPGTSANRWAVSEPDDSRTDAYKGVNKLPCPDDPNRTHWLVDC